MQRVAIARAVVHRPALILADEPTDDLDSTTGTQVLNLLREISEENDAAVLMVTHSEEAAEHLPSCAADVGWTTRMTPANTSADTVVAGLC